MKNIILIGFMGTGKSRISKLLAEKYKLKIIDTDHRIEEKANRKIKDIFKEDGEAAFRAMETSLIKDELVNLKDTVISCGGGMPLLDCNRELLKEAGIVFLLSASPEEIYLRVKNDDSRPLLAVDNPQKRIVELLEKRNPLYTKAADYIIDTDKKEPEEIADEIYEIMKRGDSSDD